MKKILVIANLYPSKDDPTFGTFVKNFVDEIYEYMPEVVVEKSVISGRTSSAIIKILKYIRFYSVTFYKLMLRRYDLVYIHYISHSIPPVWLVSKLKRLQIAFNIHGDDLLVKNKQGEFFLNMAITLMKTSKLVVVPSEYFAEILINIVPEISKKAIFVSPSGGIKPSFFIRESHSVDGVLRIGYVSRVDKGKGWDVFLQSVAQLKAKGLKVQAKVIGKGRQVDEMYAMIKELEIDGEVKYLGPIPHDELPKFYREFDLFIFPTTLFESLGLVGLEAMASGTPVIGSRIGGLVTYIDDSKNGYLFEPGNFNDLSEKIRIFCLLSDKEKDNLRDVARKTALDYRSELISKRLFDKINEIYN